jgi:hypothetical protein
MGSASNENEVQPEVRTKLAKFNEERRGGWGPLGVGGMGWWGSASSGVRLPDGGRPVQLPDDRGKLSDYMKRQPDFERQGRFFRLKEGFEGK